MHTFKAQRQTLNGENIFLAVHGATTQLEVLSKVLARVPSIRSNGWYSEIFIDTLEDTLQDMIAQNKLNYFDSLILIETNELLFDSSGLAQISI